MKPLVALSLVFLSACGAKPEPSPVAPPPGVSVAESPSAIPTASAAPTTTTSSSSGPILSSAVLAKVCGGTCGGPTASVRVYRDASNKVTRLFRIYGSCTHSPAVYFSPDGTEGDTIPEKPITPGSAEAKKFDAIHAANTKGLTHTDTVSCSDGRRSAP